MSSYYQKAKGFSYFQVPDRLMELYPQLQDFAFHLWLLLHCGMQHNQHSPNILLTDDQIAKDPFWGDRNINAKEISRARAVLKKHSLLHYRRDGQAWMYFCTHPITGITMCPTEAARQAAELRSTEGKDAEIAKLKEELAALKAQVVPQCVLSHRKTANTYDDFEDTGQVDD
jgi:hypothetical protein